MQSILKGVGKTTGVLIVAGLATLGYYFANVPFEVYTETETKSVYSQTDDNIPGKWRPYFY